MFISLFSLFNVKDLMCHFIAFKEKKWCARMNNMASKVFLIALFDEDVFSVNYKKYRNSYNYTDTILFIIQREYMMWLNEPDAKTTGDFYIMWILKRAKFS